MNHAIENAMSKAIALAETYRGRTSPNPPVGAAILSASGEILALEAHEKAGEAHAEIRAIESLGERAQEAHTLVVTLEPCSHTGRTGPCSQAVLRTSIQQVIVGARDPNPKVSGRGIAQLKAAGLSVREGFQSDRCQLLIAPFRKWILTGLPWVSVKVAINRKGSMIPEPGQKTFTSDASLKEAHELRRRADAILSGSGTILADRPEFNVRHVRDLRETPRLLSLLDRRNRIPNDYIESAKSRGFQVRLEQDWSEALAWLGEQGALEVLVEAGPTLVESIRRNDLWDEWFEIRQGARPQQSDRWTRTLKEPQQGRV